MNNKALSFLRQYPGQFWLLIFGQLLCMTGSGFIWPFIAIYIGDSLQISLSTVSLILTLRAVATLFSSFFIGPLTDKIGRKIVLAVSVFIGAASFFFLKDAHSLLFFAVLMIGWGATQPLYRISTQAMIADIIEPEYRMSAYSLLRMSMNVGVAIGPVIGGYLVKISYTFTFYIAAIFLFLVGIFTIFLVKETLTKEIAQENQKKNTYGELKNVIKDKIFMWFCLGILIVYILSSQIFSLLSSYLKTNYAITELQSGNLMAVNALMIIFLQFVVARKIQKFNPMWMMLLGASFYILGVSSNALGTVYWHFIISMMIVTSGELVLAPTATTFTANQAPPHLRGQYMSIFGLANGVGYGLGPVVGALFNDHVSPQATWYGSGLVGISAAVIFFILARNYKPKQDVLVIEKETAAD
jgi:MFS family permease